MTIQNCTNLYGVAKWIVDPVRGRGTHTTIQGAINAASSGQTIFVRPGIYTENPTLKAGVNICAFDCDALTPNVTINGKCSFASTGTVTISGIQLQTNSDFLLAVTGSAASFIYLKDCYVNCLNNNGIQYTSSSNLSGIVLQDCRGNIATTGISLGTVAAGSGGAVFLALVNCEIGNSGSSTTATTTTSGAISLTNSTIFFPLASTSSGGIETYFSQVICGTNTTAITANGSGSSELLYSRFVSGTATAITTSQSLPIYDCEVVSSNTNAIAGAGQILYGGVLFTGTSSNISTVTQTPLPWPVKQGGTGQSTLTNHGVLVGAGTSAITQLAAGSAGQALLSGGASADPAYSTPTYPSASGSTGVILRSDGTNNLYTTATYPATTGANTFLTSVAANTVATSTFIPQTNWTPTLNFGGATTGITYAQQFGYYQKIGSIIYFFMWIALSSKGSATGSATITGFPSNFSQFYDFPCIGEVVTLTTTNLQMYLQGQNGGTSANINQITITGTISAVTNTNFANNSQILLSGLYFT